MANYKPAFNYWANTFRVDPGVLYNIGKLESNFRPNAINNWDINAKNGTPSYGLMQFIQPTFNSFYRQAASSRPNAFKKLGKANWKDPRQQIAVAAWALANGKGSHWATYDRARKMAGPIGGGVNGAFAGASPGASGKVTFDTGSWKPGKPLDTGKINRVNRLFASTPWKIDNILEPVYKAAEPTFVPGSKEYRYNLPGSAGGRVGGFPGQNPDLDRMLKFFKNRFGLQVQGDFQTTGGKHSRDSLHYSGRAIDFGDANTSAAQFRRLAAWAKANRSRIKEFYFDKNPWYIKNGQIIRGTFGGHGDHAHVAW